MKVSDLINKIVALGEERFELVSLDDGGNPYDTIQVFIHPSADENGEDSWQVGLLRPTQAELQQADAFEEYDNRKCLSIIQSEVHFFTEGPTLMAALNELYLTLSEAEMECDYSYRVIPVDA